MIMCSDVYIAYLSRLTSKVYFYCSFFFSFLFFSFFFSFCLQQYAIKFVHDLMQVGGFLLVFWFPPPIKRTVTDRHDITEIFLKVALNTIIITSNSEISTLFYKNPILAGDNRHLICCWVYCRQRYLFVVDDLVRINHFKQIKQMKH